jgi:two-component system LytT family response regulator
MAPIRLLVVEDEEIARRRLVRLLRSIDGVEIVAQCENAVDAIKRVAQGGVDLLLLDVQMPGLSGLDAIELLPAERPYVIFCTAHAEHAVRAFDVGAIDYLVKPIDAERLEKAVERARGTIVLRRSRGESGEVRSNVEPPRIERLAIPTRQGIVLLDPSEISHAIVDGELVTIHAGAAHYVTDFSLQMLLEKLPSGCFERVHRKALLNMAHVARLEPNEAGGLVAWTLRGDSVDISRQSARSLRKRLGLR